MAGDTELIQTMAQQIFATRDHELDCGEVYELIDRFVELEQTGEDVHELLPLVWHHLELCADCFEEYEALKAFLAAYDSSA